MESPMKNMPGHEDPKQRNVGPTMQSRILESLMSLGRLFQNSTFLDIFFTNSTFFDIRVPNSNRVGQPQPVITLGNHSVHPTSSDMQR